MDGAFGLKPHFLQGDILLNCDSEKEGELFVGCAGGANVNVSFNLRRILIFRKVTWLSRLACLA